MTSLDIYGTSQNRDSFTSILLTHSVQDLGTPRGDGDRKMPLAWPGPGGASRAEHLASAGLMGKVKSDAW